LAPPAAFRKVVNLLDQEGLRVKVLQDERALSFRRPWVNPRIFSRTSRSWFNWLLLGRVVVSGGDGQVTVMAGGSVALLLILPALISAFVVIEYRSAAFVVGGLMLIVTAIAYVATSDALQTLTANALKRE
jgi:hypothetical protein